MAFLFDFGILLSIKILSHVRLNVQIHSFATDHFRFQYRPYSRIVHFQKWPPMADLSQSTFTFEYFLYISNLFWPQINVDLEFWIDDETTNIPEFNAKCYYDFFFEFE